jgi:high-affinity iron transporter
MAQMLVATLREGIEAFLIVAIAATYLSRTGRAALLPAVWCGTAAAVVASLVLGIALAEWAVAPLHEGILALVAAALVLSMVVFMLRAAKRMRAEIGARLEAAARRAGTGAWLGVFAFTLLMITREGMEMAFIAAALSRVEGSAGLLAGALGGIALAAGLAAAWARFGHRLNLPLFFQATSIFLVLFAVQLLFYAFHEFTEANAVPGIDNAYWHVATEDWAEGTVGELVAAALVLIPLAWVGITLLRHRVRPQAAG